MNKKENTLRNKRVYCRRPTRLLDITDNCRPNLRSKTILGNHGNNDMDRF